MKPKKKPEITVMSISEAVALLDRLPQEKRSEVALISASSYDQEESLFPDIGWKLELYFADTWQKNGRGAFDVELAESVTAFVKRMDSQKLIVCCDYGLSRSAGMAYAIAKHFDDNDCERFWEDRCPNPLVIEILLKAFGLPVEEDLYERASQAEADYIKKAAERAAARTQTGRGPDE